MNLLKGSRNSNFTAGMANHDNSKSPAKPDGLAKALYRWLLAPAVIRQGNLEVLLIREYLGKAPGIFVEVGANDPFIGSQTWALESDGWMGLLVEPLTEKASELCEKRKAIVEAVACGPPELDGTEAEFHVSHRKDALSSLNPIGAKPGNEFPETRRVPVRTLDSLVEKAGFEQIDFLSIDVEGFESEVLKGATLERLRPRLCLIEDWAIDWTVHRQMTAAGYKRVRRTQVNSWYVPREARFPVSILGRFQLFRKYVLNVPIHRMRHRAAAG